MFELGAIPEWPQKRGWKTRSSFRQAVTAGFGIVIVLISAGALIGTTVSAEGLQSREASQEEQGLPNYPADSVASPDPTVSGGDGVFLALLDELAVQPESVQSYDRALFTHWLDLDGNGCDAREEVLLTQSVIPITLGPNCDLAGGLWVSVYDGIQTADPAEFDIDHFIPLAEAWASGAADWDQDTRMRFANDLDYSMSLIAVSASSNRSRGAKDPAEWLPDNAGYICQYVFSWVNVKYRWDLSVDVIEKEALEELWRPCSVEELDSAVIATRAEINRLPAGSNRTESDADAG